MIPRILLSGLAAAGLLGSVPAVAQQPDGTRGNPPSTATQRAADRLTGSAPTPADGTPGNPQGTAASRATDRALGTNTSGAKQRRGTRHRAASSNTSR